MDAALRAAQVSLFLWMDQKARLIFPKRMPCRYRTDHKCGKAQVLLCAGIHRPTFRDRMQHRCAEQDPWTDKLQEAHMQEL